MNDQFSSLERDELQKLLNRIDALTEAIEKSGYAFCDSSLLFVPSKNEEGDMTLNIHLIDLAHGFKENQGIDGHKENVEEIIKAVKYLSCS